ncbi:MAG: M28 family peptidase [Bacteroidales bacterium]|nr:M28 family peptidase [Bacteroidales bacterium]
MKAKTIILLSFIVGLAFSPSVNAQEASADTLMKHIRKLSSSFYEGRMAGSTGFDKAAQYVIDVLSNYGVEPYEDGDWMKHTFEVESNRIDNASLQTYVHVEDVRTEYVLGKDFACASMTGRGYADAPVVFCGYGIDNTIYNEYAKIDARGKIVLVLTGAPNFLPQTIADKYTTLRDKARTAQRHGAVALVAINISEQCRPTEVQCMGYCGEGPHLTTFPILQATRWCGSKLLENERMGIDSIISQIDSTQKPQSFLLDKKFAINVNASYKPNAITGNVVGIMKGKDHRLDREMIVVGTSLDHIAMQGKTCLFPGADNNASGVASLLEVARMLSEADEFQGRSVVFAIFSGGEQGHIGSDIFVKTFNPLAWIDAFINIECVGSGDSIALLGNKRYPKLWSIAAHNDSLYTQQAKLDIMAAPRTDAVAFDRIGIPSISIFTTNGHRYNHVPSDIPENVNRKMVANTTTLLYHTLIELCNGDYQGRSLESRRTRF